MFDRDGVVHGDPLDLSDPLGEGREEPGERAVAALVVFRGFAEEGLEPRGVALWRRASKDIRPLAGALGGRRNSVCLFQ